MSMPGTAAAPLARQTQMNTRIDATLKGAGDAVLARLGYTPSAAVRIEPDAASALSDEAARKASAISGLRSLYAQTADELGIVAAQDTDLPPWDDLRDAWYDERLEREA